MVSDDEIRLEFRNYSLSNVQKAAEKCEKNGCPSYVHCFMVRSVDSPAAHVVCAKRIMQVMEEMPEKKSNRCCG